MGADEVPEGSQPALEQDVAGIPVGDGRVLGPARDDAGEVAEPPDARMDAVLRERHDLDARRLEPRSLAGMQAVRDRRDRLAIARAAEGRRGTGGGTGRSGSGRRRSGCGGPLRVAGRSSARLGATLVPRPEPAERGPPDSVAAGARRRAPRDSRSRSRPGGGRRSSTGIRTSRAPSGTSAPPAARGGRGRRPSRHAGDNPSSASPRHLAGAVGRHRGEAGPRRRASTSRATHPGARTTSSSRHITQGEVPSRFPSFRARAIVSQRLGSSGRGVPTTRCTRSSTPRWASMPRHTSSRGGDRSRLREDDRSTYQRK